MKDTWDWQRDYYHSDPSYGRDDYEPVIAIVRGLLNNPIDDFCWERARSYTLDDNSLLAQTFIHGMGMQRDVRGLPILRDKLGQIDCEEVTMACPLFPAGKLLELLCLEAIARIGGPDARDIIERYRSDPAKSYLAEGLATIEVAPEAHDPVLPLPTDFPEPLRNVRSFNDVVSEGGCASDKAPEQVEAFREAYRSLAFPGVIEHLSGDGETTTFRPRTKFADLLHDRADPFTDFAIYHSDPKIEYPIGQRRWAISHTFLGFHMLDGAFYHKEYTWNTEDNTIETHFHEPAFEEATLEPDGRSVTVSKGPISTGIELRGNVFSKQCTSAVRGVWDNPEKQGTNYYLRRANVLLPYKSIYYFRPLHVPIVNQFGIWVVDESERPERFFDRQGNCIDVENVIEELLIPLHQPKVLAWRDVQYQPSGPDDPFAARLPRKMWPELTPVPPKDYLDPYLGARFEHSRCCQAGVQQGNENGYRNGLDLNADGIIDQRDQEILAREAGKVYRANIGDWGYFGMNWLSPGWWGRTERSLDLKRLFVCSYDYGAGYGPDTGVIRLFESPPAGKRLYVEYYYDAPAAAGKDNIKLYLHPGFG